MTGLKVYNKVCLNCNRTIQGVYTTESSSATEAHELVDGKCTKCGYVNTCTHAKKSTWEKYDECGYSDDGDQGHKVTTHVLTGYTCLDCGESVILSRSDETVIIEAHNYL